MNAEPIPLAQQLRQLRREDSWVAGYIRKCRILDLEAAQREAIRARRARIGQARLAALRYRAGGKPSKGTPPDKRLSENRPKPRPKPRPQR